MTGDALVWPILTGLKTCLTYWLGQATRPVCHAAVHFNGNLPPMDACDCTCPNGGHGQAWVRMVTLNAASGAQSMPQCVNGLFDLTVEVGIYRCTPVPEGQDPLPVETIETHAAGMYCDAAVLRRAVRCCHYLDQRHIEPVITTENAHGPMGGCVGVTLQADLQVVDCSCDEAAMLL